MELADTSVSFIVLLGALTPFLTAIVTKLQDPDWFKGLVSLTASVALGLVGSLESSGEIVLSDVITNGLSVWGLHLMTYFGISKEAVSKVAKVSQRFGPLTLRRSRESSFSL